MPTVTALFYFSFIFIPISISNLCFAETNSTLFKIQPTAGQSKTVLSSLKWSTNLISHVPRPHGRTAQIPLDSVSPILEVQNLLLNTSFHGYATIPVATFRTNEATLQIMDTAAKDFSGRIAVQRLIINPDRPNIFVSQALLVVPPDYRDTLNTSELAINYTALDLYGVTLTSPPFATGSLPFRRNATGQVLVIGLGGGQLNNFLHYNFPRLNITVIELQPAIGYIAKKYFGFREDATQHLLIMDGLKYLEDASRKGQKFDAIYIDACPSTYPFNKEILCPGNQFLNMSSIRMINNILSDDGTLTIKMLLITANVIGRAVQLSQPFREIFGHCLVVPMASPNNKVLICTGKNREMDPERIWNEIMSFHAPHD